MPGGYPAHRGCFAPIPASQFLQETLCHYLAQNASGARKRAKSRQTISPEMAPFQDTHYYMNFGLGSLAKMTYFSFRMTLQIANISSNQTLLLSI